MTLYKADGSQLTKTEIEDLLTPIPDNDPWLEVNETIYLGKVPDGTVFPEAQRLLLWPEGRRVRRSWVNSQFPTATITSVTPATGPAAGGTRVTAKGSGFTPGSTVKLDGVDVVNLKVIDSGELEFTTPAHAAGAGDLVVTTDTGPVTEEDAFTWA